MNDKIVKLVVDNEVNLSGKAAQERIVQFLRDAADEVERNPDYAEKAVVVVYAVNPEDPSLFRLYSRRCNIGRVEHAGLIAMAAADVCDS